MNEVFLPRTGGTAMPEVLDIRHLDEVIALQDATRDALPEDQKMFVLPQSAEYFQGLLTRETGLMIGIRSGDRLVAQMALMGPMTLEQAVDRNTITRSEVSFHHAAPSDTVVVAKSMSVHPEMRGNDLAQHLLQTALAQSTVRLTDHVFAQISVENVRSWELFLRNGFGIVAASLDPQDGKPRFVLQKPALGFGTHVMSSADGLNPVTDFPAIIRLTHHEALIGLLELEPYARLVFYARNEMAASWYGNAQLTRGGQ